MSKFTWLLVFCVIICLQQLAAQVDLSNFEWKAIYNLDSRSIYFLFDDQKQLYAGISGKGVYRSVNQGTTWTEVDSAQGMHEPTTMRKYGNKYYVVTLEGSVFESDDGNIFQKKPGTIFRNELWDLAVWQNDLYVCGKKGVFLVRDSLEWSSELPTNLYQHEPIYAMDAKAGLMIAAGSQRVYIKTQSANTWRIAPFNFEFDIHNLTIFNNQTILVGTNGVGGFLSTDQGDSWIPVDMDQMRGNIIFFSKSEPNEIISNSSRGLYKQNVNLNKGDIVAEFRTLAFHQDFYYAGTTRDGIWKFSEPKLPLEIDENKHKILPSEKVFLRLVPNPSEGYINIEFSHELKSPGPYEIRFFDMHGKLFAKELLTSQPGFSVKSIFLNAPPGIYHYDLVGNEQLLTSGKIVISK